MYLTICKVHLLIFFCVLFVDILQYPLLLIKTIQYKTTSNNEIIENILNAFVRII